MKPPYEPYSLGRVGLDTGVGVSRVAIDDKEWELGECRYLAIREKMEDLPFGNRVVEVLRLRIL